MRYAIIENGKVANIVVSGSALAINWIQSDTAMIGDSYSNGEFTEKVSPAPPPLTAEELIDSEMTRQMEDVWICLKVLGDIPVQRQDELDRKKAWRAELVAVL